MTDSSALTDMLEEYAGNPFIEHLPTEPQPEDIMRTLDKPPVWSENDRMRRSGQRWHCIMRLANDYSQPTVSAIEFGMYLDLVIKRGYVGRNPATTDYVRGLELVADLGARIDSGTKWAELDLTPHFHTSLGFAALGTPGSGKTHAVEAACKRYKQVIRHVTPMQLYQIVWLRIECPPNGNPKGLCEFFFQQVDLALRKEGVNSGYARQYRGKTLDVMMAGMARVASLHAIGVLIVDEIQNVKKENQDLKASVLNFLVTMRNMIGIPVVMVGTMAAQQLLQRTMHDARRGDGLGSLYFERFSPQSPGSPHFSKEFRQFVSKLWRWQWTAENTPLDDDILKALYQETQGVIDLIVKLFILVQMRLVLTASKRNLPEVITPKLIHDVAEARFRIVRPYVKALRSNDPKELAKYDDLLDFHKEFQKYVMGIGTGLNAPAVMDAFDSEPSLTARPKSSAIDESSFDILLAGQNLPQKRRDWIIAKARELAGSDDLGAVLSAMVQAMEADKAMHGQAAKPKLKRAEPVEGDSRKGARDDETGEDAYSRLAADGHIGFGDDV